LPGAENGGWRSGFRTDADHDSEVMSISHYEVMPIKKKDKIGMVIDRSDAFH